ncbi:MAG: thioredoxin [Planctomycetota bacterium]
MADGLKVITDDNFETEVLGADVPVVVDFWAEWCGPCRKVSPIIEELAGDYGEQVVFGKMNVDENSETPVKFGIMSIPTVILFKDGEAVDKMIGARSKADYKSWIDSKI